MSEWPVSECVSGHGVTLHRLKRSWSLLLGDRMLWGGSHLNGCYVLCVSSDGGPFVGDFLYHPCSFKAVLGSPETLN